MKHLQYFQKTTTLGAAKVVMLTDGIIAPLAGPSPVVLIATATTGDGKVIASGTPYRLL
jgi:hypothetical protein